MTSLRISPCVFLGLFLTFFPCHVVISNRLGVLHNRDGIFNLLPEEEEIDLAPQQDKTSSSIKKGLEYSQPDSERRMNNNNNNVFEKIDYYQELRNEHGVETSIPEVYNVTIQQQQEEQAVQYNFRHVSILHPMTIPIAPGVKIPYSQGIRSILASILAFHDFNHNISTVVPSVATETDACPNLKFTSNVLDTEVSIGVGTKLTSELLWLHPKQRSTTTTGSGSSSNPSFIATEIPPYPTAILGAAVSSVSQSMSILTSVKSIPQISSVSTSGILDNKGVYSTFGRVVPPDQGNAHAIVSYFSQVLNVQHLAILFQGDGYGTNYAQAIKHAASSLDPPMKVIQASFTPTTLDYVELNSTLKYLQSSGYRYFFAPLLSQDYNHVMLQAYHYNITGPGYFWMFGEAMTGLHVRKYVPDSPLARATTNVFFISPVSPATLPQFTTSRFSEFEDHYVHATKAEKTKEYFSTLLTEDVRDRYNELLDNRDKYSSTNGHAAFMYEAGMAIAIAACRAQQQYGYKFTGQEMFQQFLTNVTFEGPMGTVMIDSKTGSRDARTVTYAISNAQPYITDDGNVSFLPVMVHAYVEPDPIHQPLYREWLKIDNPNSETNDAALFSDNTTVPPPSLPPLDLKIITIEPWAQHTGYGFSALILILSIFFSVWTALNQKTKVVRASQPIFLYMLCSGTAIIGLAIVPLTFQDPALIDLDNDDDDDNSNNALDMACMITPWFISGGFIIAFAAILSKLRRANAIFHSRSHVRVVVSAKDVMRPFISLFVLNMTILIAWTVLDPLKYTIYHTNATDRYDRRIEMYGRCIEHDPSAYYVAFASLWFMLILTVVLWANKEAYKARSIKVEYSESRYLAISMALILQSILIGFPLLFVVDALPTFWYLVKICILFIVCISMLLPIFIPKMVHLKYWREEQSMREMRKSEKMQKWAEMKARVNEENVNPPLNLMHSSNTIGDVGIGETTERTRRMS